MFPTVPSAYRVLQEKPEAKRPVERRKGTPGQGRNPSKRQHSSDNEDDDAAGPKDPKKPTFVAIKVTGEDVNTAFGKDIERSCTARTHTLAMIATRTLPIRDAWIVDSGSAQHVCNDASKFMQMDVYHKPALSSVDASTSLSAVGTPNILCNARGRMKWLVVDNVLSVPSAEANLVSKLHLLQRGAKVEFSIKGASSCTKSSKKIWYTASKYYGFYALDLWTNLSFPAYRVGPQVTLWHNRRAPVTGQRSTRPRLRRTATISKSPS